MRIACLIFCFSFVSFIEAQTAKIVARKSCRVVKKCTDIPNMKGGNRGFAWKGITVYDWGPDISDPLDGKPDLQWSNCVKATLQNSGKKPSILKDRCYCSDRDSNGNKKCYVKVFTPNPHNIDTSHCFGVRGKNDPTCSCSQDLDPDPNKEEKPSNCTCVEKTCPSGQTLDTTDCNCKPVCNPQSCASGYTFNSAPDKCSCECTRTCNSPFTLDADTCACECPKTPQECQANGEFLNAQTCMCEGGCTLQCNYPFTLNTSSCICECPYTELNNLCNTGQRFNLADCDCDTIDPPPACVSDSDCGVCKRCNSGQCINETTSWPTWDQSQHCSDVSETQTRCQNGVEKTRTLTGTKPTAECQCPADCTGPCKECNSQNQCINKTTNWTAWTPAWDRSEHFTCKDEDQTRKRCVSGTEENVSRTIEGTKIPGPGDCGPDGDCTPIVYCSDGVTVKIEYENNTGRLINGRCEGGVVKTRNDCPCTPEDEKCENGVDVKKRYKPSTGREDQNGECTIKPTVPSAYTLFDCPPVCEPEEKTEERDCEGGEGKETRTLTRGCTNGVLDAWTIPDWDDSNCSRSDCSGNAKCTPAGKLCYDGNGRINPDNQSGTVQCENGILTGVCEGGKITRTYGNNPPITYDWNPNCCICDPTEIKNRLNVSEEEAKCWVADNVAVLCRYNPDISPTPGPGAFNCNREADGPEVTIGCTREYNPNNGP